MAGTYDLSAEELSRLRSLLRQAHTGTAHVCTVNAFFFGFGDFEFRCCNFDLRVDRICNLKGVTCNFALILNVACNFVSVLWRLWMARAWQICPAQHSSLVVL